MAAADALDRQQRRVQPLLEQAPAHRRLGGVEHGEQAFPLGAVGQARRQLQVAPRRGVERHRVAGRVGSQRPDVGDGAHVGRPEVAEQDRGGVEAGGELVAAEAPQRRGPEVLQQRFAGRARQPVAPDPGQRRRAGGADRVGEIVHPVGDQALGRAQPRHLLDHRRRAAPGRYLGHQELAGGNVDHADTADRLAEDRRDQVVVRLRVE
jgi:hypothetical protein